MPDRVISVPQATQIAQRIKNKFDNVNGRLDDVKADFNVVQNAFDFDEQYLYSDKWIDSKYYLPNESDLGNSADFVAYPSFELKTGKYYYYHVHPSFTNIKFLSGRTVRLKDYEGTTETVNNSNGYFEISEDVTIYVSTTKTGQSNAMLSNVEKTTYIDGNVFPTVKKSAMPFTLSDINAKDVSIVEKHGCTFSKWNGPASFTANDGGFVASDSKNCGGEASVFDTNKCIEYSPYFRINFDLNGTGIDGTVTAYLSYDGTDGNRTYKAILIHTDVGHKEITVDLAYYQQYKLLGDSFNIIIACGSTSAWEMTVSNFVAESVLSTDDVGENVVDYLEYLDNQVSAVSSEVKTDKPIYLVSPDGNKYVLLVGSDGSIVGSPVIPNKTLFIGNSLLHGHGTFGMCATDEQHDYFHYVSSEINSKNAGGTFDKLSGTTFEDATNEATANTWMSGTLLQHLSNDLDLVIVQLGDNVNTAEKVSAFTTNCKNLLSYIRTQCPNARVAWVGEWYSSTVKQNIIAQACSETGAVFVNIADLVTSDNQGKIGDVIHRTSSSTKTYTVDSFTDDATNKILTVTFTVNSVQYTSELPYTSYVDNGDNTITVTGDYTVVTVAGAASHPGNAGMLAIANRICYNLGITDSETAITA